MVAFKAGLISSKTSVFTATQSLQQTNRLNLSSTCNLKWKQGKLWVSRSKSAKLNHLSVLNNAESLKKCLDRSSVEAICLDLSLGETRLQSWAEICRKVGKHVFLRIPSTPRLPQKQNLLSWRLKRILDWIAAIVLLLVLSPVMLGIALLIAISSSGPIFFQQWRVGERGKLFRIIKFRSMMVDAEKIHHLVMENQQGLHKREDDPRVTLIGRWLRKYSLDELPQLINVLRGEMSLVGPRPWALYDALRISPNLQTRLNALPGITGAWQVESRSTLLDLDAVNCRDLQYLRSWSLWQDFKVLLLTLPKVLSGFGSC
jgi:lipopolysaccharide/colanic/teichoic acid biosynthesis glycosyltransferase